MSRDKRYRPLNYFLFACAMIIASVVQGQDLHFSQFFHSPLTTNPANTGFLPEADYRVGLHHRNQWSSIPVPFKTMSVFGDAQVFRDRFPSGWVGLGGVILHDVAGSGALTSTKIYGSAAYHQMISTWGLLSAGFNLGWANKRIDINKLTFNSQWNKEFFDAQVPSGESFANNSIGYLDVQFGLNFAYFPTENIYMHGGVSMQHLNNPKESFFTSTADYDNTIARRMIFFGDAVIKINDLIILSPGAYFSWQSQATELMVGAHANFNVTGGGEHQLLAGAYYRHQDAIIPLIGYQWKNFRLTFTFDATTSSLRDYNNMYGATELSLLYNGFYSSYDGDRRQSMCPKF